LERNLATRTMYIRYQWTSYHATLYYRCLLKCLSVFRSTLYPLGHSLSDFAANIQSSQTCPDSLHRPPYTCYNSSPCSIRTLLQAFSIVHSNSNLCNYTSYLPWSNTPPRSLRLDPPRGDYDTLLLVVRNLILIFTVYKVEIIQHLTSGSDG
jgi:hypothetical protein